MIVRVRRPAGALLMVVALVALAGCSAGTRGTTADRPISVPSLAPVVIDVDTPALRRIKVRAAIETCVPGTATGSGGDLPRVTLPCLGGGPDLDLSALRGPLVINIWGSWCTPCRDELPILAGFYNRYRHQVAMLGIDFQDTQPQDALELAEDSGVRYPQVFDHDGEVGRSSVLPGPAVPALAFVDASGTVTAWVPGEVKSEQQLVDLVNQHLGLDL